MPTVYRFSAERIQPVAEAIFAGAGSPRAEAALVAGRLTKRNLTGHDSPRLIRIPPYMAWVAGGPDPPGGRRTRSQGRGVAKAANHFRR